MPPPYTNVFFSSRQPDQQTAVKLNKLRDDLSTAIAAAGGGTSTGDMLKSTYDTNNNGKVDTCDSVPWTSVTGKPATFPPDSTAMLKSVYDTNANNKVDAAESADSVPWTGISGKPAAFAPSAHGTTHLDNGSDPVPVVTTLRTGLAPTLSGNAATFLNGNGVYSTPSGVTPAAHKATHQSGGSDAIGLDTLAAPTDIATLNSSTAAHGLLPKLNGNAGTYLNGNGAWTSPSGSGDMLKSVYDTNADNIVDQAAAVPWSGVTGKPTTFTPDLTAIWKGFIAKTAAYTLTTADSGKYILCSGGSWTLTLPAPALGLLYQVRNDMGISGTTGTITLQPTGGTIDGAANLALLAGQECTLITDGSNWRSLGRQRIVVLGTQDIAALTASAFILLPPGYRTYELDFEAVLGSADGTYLSANLSADGGSTWKTDANYALGEFNPSSASAATYTGATGQAAIILTGSCGYAGTAPLSSNLVLWAGDAAKYVVWRTHNFGNGSSYYLSRIGGGFYLGGKIVVNAIRYQMSSGNILASQLTVKGIV